MRTVLVLAVLLAPAVAFAQLPSDPVGTPLPAPGGPGMQPVYTPPPTPGGPWWTHQGLTIEANIGFGYAHLTDDSTKSSVNTNAALAGLDLGIGGWLNPQLALTGRVASVNIKYDGAPDVMGTRVLAWIGPSLQYWPDPHFWMGGGIGFATYRLVGNDACSGTSTNNACGVNGFGFDFRGGYTFGTSAHTFNVSLEVNPSHFSDQGTGSGSGWGTAIAFLVGYQYL